MVVEILDKRTTKVYVNEDFNLYVGTIEDTRLLEGVLAGHLFYWHSLLG